MAKKKANKSRSAAGKLVGRDPTRAIGPGNPPAIDPPPGPGRPTGPSWGRVLGELLDGSVSPKVQEKLESALGGKVPKDYRRAVAAMAIQRALGEDGVANEAAKFLRDTEEGRPTQRVVLGGDPDAPLYTATLTEEQKQNARRKLEALKNQFRSDRA